MGPRYPGSLLAATARHCYQELRAKRAKPSQPGRLDAALAWFLKWEGLLVGGLFVGGIGSLGIKVYIQERLDDISRRHERRQFFEGACMMLSTAMAAVQHSLAMWEAIADDAAAKQRQRAAWQAQQAHQVQLAAAQLAGWRARCRAVCGSSGGMLHEPRETGSWVQQQCMRDEHARLMAPAAAAMSDLQQCEQQQQQQQQHSSSSRRNLCSGKQSAAVNVHEHEQAEQSVAIITSLEWRAEELQHGLQQLAEIIGEQELDAEETPEQSQEQQQQEQQQQQERLPAQQGERQEQQEDWGQQQSWNPLCWLCRQQLAAAQQRLEQQQQQLQLGRLGLELRQQLHAIAKQQVMRLQQLQAVHQGQLMAHVSQLAAWQQLDCRSPELTLAFTPPDPDGLMELAAATAASWLPPGAASVDGAAQGASSSGGGADGGSGGCSDAAVVQQAVTADGSNSTDGRSGRRQRSWWPWARAPAAGQQQQGGDESGAPPAPAGGGASKGARQLSVRLLLPQWIPDELHDADYEVVRATGDAMEQQQAWPWE